MELGVPDIVKWFDFANKKIQHHKDYLSALDRPIGDGDHGINMARGCKEAINKIMTKNYAEPSEVIKDVAMALLAKVGGASGPLYGTAFLKMSMAVKGYEVLSLSTLANGMEAALAGLKQRGKSDIGEKTLIDVWSPMGDYISTGEISSDGLIELARDALETSKDTMATKGRAAYFKEKSIGHIDPGSASSFYIFEALAEVIKEKE
ncbi:dihydroxyacetone kinase subunit DhaL [Paucisalibacillus sp. EB02]|uniref:dihydroxyacetone kinase subunit DhaL n=1 Tax=Paucisalibacillus sp. EB02 TaxID=1347087 RepID=UPI0004B5A836|nr:dihydroxyacetone kinase subunit DhaL [Paucisalibacillus sp. EB02]